MNPDGGSADMIRFGLFEVNTATGELRRQGLRIKLQEQPFRLLCLLLERPGELVTREQLRSRLWPADTFVDFEHGLNKAVSKLREALGDDRGTPRFIETLPRRGYRFLAPVIAAAAPAESEAAPATPSTQVPAAPAARARRLAPATILLLVLFALAASLLSYRLLRRRTSPIAATASAAPIRSLAVLPLQNLSGDRDQEYFADGITDELITDLAQMRELRVISRTSSMHYKRTAETLPQIGRELGADAVVEGTVFRAGGRVRITAQLIDARTDRHLWANEYERDLRDVLSLQDEVARDIAREISVKLTPRERARLSSPRPVNPQAHEAYLEGRYYWNQFTVPTTRKSLGFFQQAIARDPSYALGYSGLADYYGVMHIRFDALPRDQACPKGKAAALKAIELDDSLAESHLSLAALQLFCDWDLRASESEIKRAIEINPNSSQAHRVYATFLAISGRGEQANAEIARAVEDDPMAVDTNQVFGWVLYQTRHYDRAARQYRKAAAMDPKRADSIYGLGNVYTQQGRFDMAIRQYRKAIAIAREQPATSLSLAYVYALEGRRSHALEILRRTSRAPGRRPGAALDAPLSRAAVYIALGDRQHAFTWLERAYRNHDTDLLYLKSDPVYDSLRSDPRFQDLIRRVGL